MEVYWGRVKPAMSEPRTVRSGGGVFEASMGDSKTAGCGGVFVAGEAVYG